MTDNDKGLDGRAQITFDSHSVNISGGCQFLSPTDGSKTNHLSYEMASPKRRHELDSQVIKWRF